MGLKLGVGTLFLTRKVIFEYTMLPRWLLYTPRCPVYKSKDKGHKLLYDPIEPQHLIHCNNRNNTIDCAIMTWTTSVSFGHHTFFRKPRWHLEASSLRSCSLYYILAAEFDKCTSRISKIHNLILECTVVLLLPEPQIACCLTEV